MLCYACAGGFTFPQQLSCPGEEARYCFCAYAASDEKLVPVVALVEVNSFFYAAIAIEIVG